MDEISNTSKYSTKNKQIIDEIDTIKVNNLSYKYPNNNKYVLKDINFEINKNDKIGIIGLFGSGKTTLLNILASLDKPTHGEVLLDGKDLKKSLINIFQLLDEIILVLFFKILTY